MSSFLRVASSLVLGVAAAAYVQPVLAADAAAGKAVFQAQCALCHSAAPNDGGGAQGPSLQGVVGRKAASVADYKYSEAMAAKGAEGLVWTEENLAAYLPNPKAFVPKTKMAFAGLKKPEDVANVIAFLKAHP